MSKTIALKILKGSLLSLGIVVAVPAALLLALFVFLFLSDLHLANAYYRDREVLRAIHESTNWFDSRSARQIAAIRRAAFLSKLPIGSDRGEVYRKLALERVECRQTSRLLAAPPVKVECVTLGYTGDYRWHFALDFSDENKLLDANIDILKGG